MMSEAEVKWNDDGPGGEWRMPDLAEREARIRRAVVPSEIELDSPEYWDWMRGLGRGEAWNVSQTMTAMLFNEVHAEIEAEHPEWSVLDKKVEFCARMYGPTLAGHLRRWMEKEAINGDSD